jgi:hypothetical protein
MSFVMTRSSLCNVCLRRSPAVHQVVGEGAARIGLADVEQPLHLFRIFLGEILRIRRGSRRVVEECAAAVELAVEPPFFVDHGHRRTPADRDMIADRRAAGKRRLHERLAIDRG